MPLYKTYSDDCVEFEDPVTRRDIKALLDARQIKYLQTDEPAREPTWRRLNNELFSVRPEIQLRVFGFYGKRCNLNFLTHMFNVIHFSVDCIHENVDGIEHLVEMPNLKSLGLGVYGLESFDILHDVTDKLQSISLHLTRSRKPNLAPLHRFKDLRELYLEGQQKHIEVIADLKKLEKVTLKSISTPGLEYLASLKKLWSLDVKLGGIRDFSAIANMKTIKYLELWLVRGLADLSFISTMTGLQYLFLQALRNVTRLPSLTRLRKLRRADLRDLKGLKDIRGLTAAPALEELRYSDASYIEPEDFLPLLRKRRFRRARIACRNNKRQARCDQMLRDHGIHEPPKDDFRFV